VDQLTPKEVENRNKKFTWSKAKSSDQMRFEADNSGVVHHRHLHCRDERLKRVAQLAGGIIGDAIRLSDSRFFQWSVNARVVLFPIFITTSLEDEEAARTSLAPPEWALPLSATVAHAMLGVWSVSLAIEQGVEMVQRAIIGKVKDWKARVRRDGT
jgi:hypothetical protein